MKIWGIRVSFGCERSCSIHRRVSNFNSKVPQGGIYPHIKFERDRLNIFRVRVFASSGSTGGGHGGDAKTIISPNTSFADIIICKLEDQCSIIAVFPLALMMMIMMKALCECVPAATVVVITETKTTNIFILVSLK